MKKQVSFLIILLFSLHSFGQTSAVPHTKEFYQDKSTTQRTTAWILLAGGTVMAIIGASTFSSSWDSGSNSETDAAGFIFLGGIAMDLVSIPFFISASRNAQKAADLSLSMQPSLPGLQGISVRKQQPALTLKIRF
jgi:hypothetical protein